jgi:hypothetical protein
MWPGHIRPHCLSRQLVSRCRRKKRSSWRVLRILLCIWLQVSRSGRTRGGWGSLWKTGVDTMHFMNFRLYGSLWYRHFVCYAVPRISFTNTIFIIDMLTVPQALIVLEQFNQSQSAIIWPMHWSIHSYRCATSTLRKDSKTTDLPFPLVSRRVATSPPITGHMYQHEIFVLEHTATCQSTYSDYVLIQCAATFVP